MRPVTTNGLAAVALAVGTAVALTSATGALTNELILLIGAGTAVAGVMLGVSRSRRAEGRIDPFHPLVLPLAYLAISFLAPAWAFFVQQKSMLGFSAYMMDPRTPALLLTATVGVTAGLAIPFRRRELTEWSANPRVTNHLGRLTLLVPLALNIYSVASNSVETRGVDQFTRTGLTSVWVLGSLLIPVATLLLLNSQPHGRRSLLRGSEWVLLLGLAGSAALAGGRNASVTIALLLLYAYSRRPNYRKSIIAGILVAILAGSIAISSYRLAERGAVVRQGTQIASVLTDLSVATYSTGLTARGVPEVTPFRNGGTYADALARQLPAELANRFSGPPVDTGNETFRRLIGATDPNQGWGYSLPAEGYLNFGTLGVLGACFLWGAFAAWTYSRRQWPGTHTWGLVYPILIATMPIAVRSDAVGMFKIVLYPTLVMLAALTISRSRHESVFERRTRRAGLRPLRAPLSSSYSEVAGAKFAGRSSPGVRHGATSPRGMVGPVSSRRRRPAR